MNYRLFSEENQEISGELELLQTSNLKFPHDIISKVAGLGFSDLFHALKGLWGMMSSCENLSGYLQ